jgi:hypothetical protein
VPSRQPLSEKQRRALHRLIRFIEPSPGKRLKDVRHVGGDVEDDVYAGGRW